MPGKPPWNFELCTYLQKRSAKIYPLGLKVSQKEWRLISLSQTNFTLQIEPQHITSIFLGAKMPTNDRNEVIALKQSTYNHAKLYQARLLTGTSGLGIELIS